MNEKTVNILKMLLFLMYVSSIFWMDAYGLIIVFVINLVIALKVKLNFYNMLRNIGKVAIFILITVGLNLFFISYWEAILVGIRIILVCNITYIYSQITTANSIAESIEIIFSPLKKIGINTEGVSLIVSIAIAFLPILKNQILQLRLTLKAKGIKINIHNTTFILGQVIASIFKRTDEIEMAILAKGYIEK